MLDPLVSVIIPNYNHSEFLEERINSVLKQDYKNFEIIILDDNSTDASAEVIERYRSNNYVSHIKYNDQNSGSTFIQWNRGFNLAKGDLIWIAESDDSCDEHMLSELVQSFTNDTCVLSVCRSIIINSKGEVTGRKLHDKQNECIAGSTFIKRYLSWGNFIPNVSSALFKKDIALKLDNDYMNFLGAGDHFFWILLSEHGNVSIINKQLNYFRRHENVVTSRRNIDGTNAIEARKIFDYMNKMSYLSLFRKFIVKSRNIFIISKLSISSEELKTKLYNEWHCDVKLLPLYNMIGWFYDLFLFKFKIYI